ncbi:hypothetical protein [Natronorubrum halalkaliphilum]|uniref:hypothetical protein n=1 Tax=Natronorubrum halalkaliphilum TaxID=2691917 RepID=UPI001915FBE6|nr:hypothetical protein [Natronorubrum halalkaliphilum]
MSSCSTCGNQSWLCQQCKLDDLEDRHGSPADQDVNHWVLGDDRELWHASTDFDAGVHTCACDDEIPTPLEWSSEDLRYVPDRYAEVPVCQGCVARLEGTRAETVPDDATFERASELRADGGRSETDRLERAVREAAVLVEAGDTTRAAVATAATAHRVEHRRDDVLERVHDRRDGQLVTDGGRPLHRANCEDCSWSYSNDDLVDVSDEMERHARKEMHDIDLERAVATDGGRVNSSSDTEHPEVVCLCGSTRFKETYREANERLTMEGKIVLSCGVFGHADGVSFSEGEKQMLDALHKRKIDLADRIHVINVAGYIGDSTQSEIEYARETNTEISYLVQPVVTDGGQSVDGTDRDKSDVMPSQLGASITVEIPMFECEYCGDDTERVAREDSEWVHHTCGMPVSDHFAETANEQLENGVFDRGIVEHEANAAAQRIIPQLENADERSQDAATDPDSDSENPTRTEGGDQA